MIDSQSISAILRHFAIPGEFGGFISAAPIRSGHINDTYGAVFERQGKQSRVILQRINHSIFKNPAALMENIQRVTNHIGHIATQCAGDAEQDRRTLTLILTRDGRAWHSTDDGNHWRVYRFIERARTFDTVESPQQAYRAARAFGQFQQQLANLPAPRLHETIPDFHHTPKRFAAFQQALVADAANRAANAKDEIAFALANEPIAGVLLQAQLAERVTHNDTKFNNVMLDESTGEALCVIDLDTVMPGLALYDFGDMVRTATSPAEEDERDLAKVTMQFPMFEALARGYLSAAGIFLTSAEKQHLVFAGKLMAFEQGIRFLTDYLAGDPYYKVHREGHNLDRCRTQFKLIQSIERQEERMHRLIESIVRP